jgi:diacylglycerol O-acyltransferase
MDAMFLYWETPTAHQHILKISILDYSSTPGGYSFAKFREQMRNRMHLLPLFRRRLLNTPLGLHYAAVAAESRSKPNAGLSGDGSAI